jgi:hypothetical protein
MRNGSNFHKRGHFIRVILGLAVLMTVFGFSSLYAGDLLVYWQFTFRPLKRPIRTSTLISFGIQPVL